MIRIFFSYASADSALVLRVYNDLARSEGARIWCFELDERPGYNFREEYLESIRHADYFLLFDSPAARKSRYVREEVAEWQGAERHHPILPCLAVPTGAWRREAELFEHHNLQVFIDLTDYVLGIEKLHEFLGTVPVPSFTRPRDQEFADELANLRPALGPATYRRALQHYEAFETSRAHFPDLALARLEVMIEEIASACGRCAGSVLLTLADDYFVLNRFGSAIRTFTRVCECRPKDPRGWAGLGFARAKQQDYRGAAESLEKSLAAIDAFSKPVFLSQRIEVVNALCTMLILIRRYRKAWKLVESEIVAGRANAISYGFGARLQWLQGESVQAGRLLAEATARIDRQERADPTELSDLIDIARQLGEERALETFSTAAVRQFPDHPRLLRDAAAARADLGDQRSAMLYLEQAWRLAQDDVRVGVELALLRRETGHSGQAEQVLARVLQNSTGTGEHAYYIGLAHHLSGRRECADHFLEAARRDADVRSWPAYREISGRMH